MKNKKRITLSGLLMLVMGSLVAGSFLLCWILNETLLERYYSYKKQQDLSSAYQVFNQSALDGSIESEAFDNTFEQLCNNGNFVAVVIDSNRVIVRASSFNTAALERDISDMIYGPRDKESTWLVEKKEYGIQKMIDRRLNEEYMVLLGALEDGSILYLRTPFESIRESAKVTSMFFSYISIGTFFISLIVIVFVAKSIAKPIKQMSKLSEAMTNLDFEAKYISNQNTPMELDSLGNSMNQLSGTLEKTISELKSANIELQQDIEKKEEIDEMRKEFVSNVSHELKTPLALIQGYAEGLQEGISDDPESRSFYLEVIQDEAEKMNAMVKKLLTLNQLEFGNEPVEMKRFNLMEVVEGVTNASMLLLEQNKIELKIEEKAPVYVWGDEYKIEEVITNYLSNAIHYAKGEHKQIRIWLTRNDELVRLSVFNSGEPIPEESIDRIWEKFYKVDKARTREYGGNGIGLSIVKAIMDSMSQKCGVINHDNGVEFWLEMDGKN